MPTARSATGAGVMVVTAVAVLLSGVTSAWLEPTVATLVSNPEMMGVTLRVTWAVAPTRILSKEQTMVPARLVHVPCEAEAETKFTLAGSTLVTATLVATRGPALVTVIV